MSALNQMNLSRLGPMRDLAIKLVATEIWKWFHENKDRIVFQKKVLLFTLKVRIGDLRMVFEAIFGEEPTQVPPST